MFRQQLFPALQQYFRPLALIALCLFILTQSPDRFSSVASTEVLPGAAAEIQAGAGIQAAAIAANPLSGFRAEHTATLVQDSRVLVAGGRSSTGGSGLDTAELYNPATGNWTSTGSRMIEGRYGHVAVVLRNGEILVAGGRRNATTVLGSLEIYNFATNNWASVNGQLRVPRYKPTATLLQDGTVLYVGGEGSNGAALRSAEIFDPTTRTSQLVGQLTDARRDHTATLIGTQLLVVGGSNGSTTLDSAEIFDYYLRRWFTVGRMATPRRRHTATLMANRTVLVAGGENVATPLNSVEIFIPLLERFDSDLPNMATARRAHSATLLPSGSVLLLGGLGASGALDGAEVFDPNTRSWSGARTFQNQPFNLIARRSGHTATILHTGRVLVVAGIGGSGQPIGEVEVFDYAQGRFEQIQPVMGRTRQRHTATLTLRGEVLIAGGTTEGGFEGGGQPLSHIEIYNPNTRTWQQPDAALRVARFGHTATLLPNGNILIVGGRGQSGALASAELCDVRGFCNLTSGSMSVARVNHTATLLRNGKVLVTGGQGDGSTIHRSAELYDPETGFWSGAGQMSSNRFFHSATLLPSGKVLVAGGLTGASQATDVSELYNPQTNGWAQTVRDSSCGLDRCKRYGHTSTLLINNKVLLAGGRIGRNAANVGQLGSSAQLFNAETESWESTRDLQNKRVFHTATVLPNGKVLIFGGFVNANFSQPSIAFPEIYDPTAALPTSDLILPLNPVPLDRGHHTATLLPSGQVLLAGGSDQDNGDVGPVLVTRGEVFDMGLGFTGGSQPVLGNIRNSVSFTSARVFGARLVGVSEASGDGNQSSATNYPVGQLIDLDNGRITMAPPNSIGWSETRYNFAIPTLRPSLLIVFVNGIPSRSLTFPFPGLGGSIKGRSAKSNGDPYRTPPRATIAPPGCYPQNETSPNCRNFIVQQTVNSSGEFEFTGLEPIITSYSVSCSDNGCRIVVGNPPPPQDYDLTIEGMSDDGQRFTDIRKFRIDFREAIPIGDGNSFSTIGAVAITQDPEQDADPPDCDNRALPGPDNRVICYSCCADVRASLRSFKLFSGTISGAGAPDPSLPAPVDSLTLTVKLAYEDLGNNLECKGGPCAPGVETEIDGVICAKANPETLNSPFCACTEMTNGICSGTVIDRRTGVTTETSSISIMRSGLYSAKVPDGANFFIEASSTCYDFRFDLGQTGDSNCYSHLIQQGNNKIFGSDLSCDLLHRMLSPTVRMPQMPPVADAGPDLVDVQIGSIPVAFNLAGRAERGAPRWSTTVPAATAELTNQNQPNAQILVKTTGTVPVRLTVTSNEVECFRQTDDATLTVNSAIVTPVSLGGSPVNGSLTVNSNRQARILTPPPSENRYFDLYSFTISSPQRAVLSLSNFSAFDAVLTLLRDAGGRLETVGDSNNPGQGAVKSLTHDLTIPGVYYIKVSTQAPNQIGSYRLALSADSGASNSLSGTVAYCGAATPRGVPGVALTAAGAPSGSATTDAGGGYRITGLGAGSYTLTPSRTGNAEGIRAIDAQLVARHTVSAEGSPDRLQGCKLLAGDASGDGRVGSLDASLILRKSVGINEGQTGSWIFSPARQQIQSLNGNQVHDFTGILVGDVDGSWQPPANPGGNEFERLVNSGSSWNRLVNNLVNVAVTLPETTVETNAEVVVPINVGSLTGMNVIAYEFEIAFDPAVLQLLTPRLDKAGTLSSEFTVIDNDPTPGRLRVAAFGLNPVSGGGVLLKLRFRAIGASGTTGTLNWVRFLFNAGEPAVSTSNGRVAIGSASTFVSVSAASFRAGAIARGAIVAGFGAGLATGVDVAQSVPLPTQLLGTSVEVRDGLGVVRMAPLFFVSAQQINYFMPEDVGLGMVTITVRSGNGGLSVGQVEVRGAVVSLFTANSDGAGAATAFALYLGANGAQRFENGFEFNAATSRFVPRCLSIDGQGESVFLVLYGTGIRGLAAIPRLTISDEELPVLYAGSQGAFVGLDQINAGPLPRSLVGKGMVTLLLRGEGLESNPVQICIR